MVIRRPVSKIVPYIPCEHSPAWTVALICEMFETKLMIIHTMAELWIILVKIHTTKARDYEINKTFGEPAGVDYYFYATLKIFTLCQNWVAIFPDRPTALPSLSIIYFFNSNMTLADNFVIFITWPRSICFCSVISAIYRYLVCCSLMVFIVFMSVSLQHFI